jgi:hypothetical protein
VAAVSEHVTVKTEPPKSNLGWEDSATCSPASTPTRGSEAERVQEVLMQGRFATGLFQGGDVLETADGQAQIEFGQERL